jgi:XTP/dITP diphosphohydrolase
MQTLRHLTIEETYELGDVILDNDLNEVKKELGDLMLHHCMLKLKRNK